MIFGTQTPPRPQHGETRQTVYFAWLQTPLSDGRTCWLERFVETERYYADWLVMDWYFVSRLPLREHKP